MSTDGSARAFGVGACARLIPTIGGPGEASGPRTDGFHWLGYPRTPPRHSGARPRRPLWVAVMACLWGDVLSKKNPGDTGPRRQQEFHWRDHGLTIERREPKNYRFHPQVLAVSVSLDHERPERSSNPLTGASASCGYEHIASVVNFFGYVPYLKPSGHKRESARTFISRLRASCCRVGRRA